MVAAMIVIAWLRFVFAGRGEAAAQLFGAVDGIRKSVRMILAPRDRTRYQSRIAAVRAALEEEAFATAWVRGKAMNLDEAIAYALPN